MTDQVEDVGIGDYERGALLAFKRGLETLKPDEYEDRKNVVIADVLEKLQRALLESCLGLWTTKAGRDHIFARSALKNDQTSDEYYHSGAVVVKTVNSSLLLTHRHGAYSFELDYDAGLDLLTVSRMTRAAKTEIVETGPRNVGEALAEAIVEALAKEPRR